MKTGHLLALLIFQSICNGFAQTPPRFTPGSLDLSFDAGELTRRSPGPWFTFMVQDMALSPDAKVYLVGHFDSVQGFMRDGVTRLFGDGRLDNSFENPRLGSTPERSNIFSADLHYVSAQENGDLMVGYGCFRRLKPDGLIDESLTNCLREFAAVLPNGDIISQEDASSEDTLRIFFPDGKMTPDSPRLTRPVLLQSDGKIVAAEGRWTSDRTPDTTFRWPSMAVVPEFSSEAIPAIVWQPDGKYLRAGMFSHVDGTSRNLLARFRPDGGFDPSFNANSVLALSNVFLRTIAVQLDGKVLLGISGHAIRNGIVRLNPDGTLDDTFKLTGPTLEVSDAGTHAVAHVPGLVNKIVVQPDGRILIGGFFTHVSGVRRFHIARLHGDGNPPPEFVVAVSEMAGGNTLRLAVSGPTGSDLRLQRSTNLRDWEAWRSFRLTESLTNFVDSRASTVVHQFYRAISP
jgi:uncharacterized delta-60 repeat protein